VHRCLHFCERSTNSSPAFKVSFDQTRDEILCPESAHYIVPFIKIHRHDILELIDSFKNFTELFHRKLKPSPRPVKLSDDLFPLVSCADCRLMTFEYINDATRFWIKFRVFAVERLLGDVYKCQTQQYYSGAFATFWLISSPLLMEQLDPWLLFSVNTIWWMFAGTEKPFGRSGFLEGHHSSPKGASNPTHPILAWVGYMMVLGQTGYYSHS